MIEIDERIAVPDPLLEFLPGYGFAGTLKQNLENLEGLNLEFNTDSVLAQFTDVEVGSKWAEVDGTL
jgi:hypothetical protein